MSDTLYVLAASYDEVDSALSDFEAIEAAYRHVGSTGAGWGHASGA